MGFQADASSGSSEDFEESLRSKEQIDYPSLVWGLVARYINEGRGSGARDATLRDLSVLLRPKHDDKYRVGLQELHLSKVNGTWKDNNGTVSWHEHAQDVWFGLVGELMDRSGLFGKPDIIYKDSLI